MEVCSLADSPYPKKRLLLFVYMYLSHSEYFETPAQHLGLRIADLLDIPAVEIDDRPGYRHRTAHADPAMKSDGNNSHDQRFS